MEQTWLYYILQVWVKDVKDEQAGGCGKAIVVSYKAKLTALQVIFISVGNMYKS